MLPGGHRRTLTKCLHLHRRAWERRLPAKHPHREMQENKAPQTGGPPALPPGSIPSAELPAGSGKARTPAPQRTSKRSPEGCRVSRKDSQRESAGHCSGSQNPGSACPPDRRWQELPETRAGTRTGTAQRGGPAAGRRPRCRLPFSGHRSFPPTPRETGEEA